ncbi:hypothetical protein BT96DRAFT_712517 [Gymnopus androsaceus JB14]|uniref:Mid2 domain-containing protein n=1 Tax=Gymnopus androsaceus JB14 TaxID=1447944 RepID=A0A6A4HN06_9AGAR|nr:hypothetical protein BT96DRAFT_712517 [Gymnopus androsaceus JB14]
MSTSCTSSPTSTDTQLVTSTTVSTTFSVETTTLPGTPSPIVSTFCAAFSTPSPLSTTLGTSVCISTGTSTIGTTTIGGGVTTTQVPGVTTIFNTITQFSTLFGSSCTVINTTPAPTPSTVTVLSVTTPPPSTITFQSTSTLANGQVTAQMVTLTSTLPPSSFIVTSTSTGFLANETGGSSTSSSSSHLGAIIGGALGGALALIAVLVLVWCFIMRRRRRWDDIFDKDIYTVTNSSSKKRFALDDVEPKPYDYGLVGALPTLSNALPLSPDMGMRPTTAGTMQGSVSPPVTPDSSSRPISSGTVHSTASGHPASTDGYFNDHRLSSFSSAMDGERKFQVVNGTGSRASILSSPDVHLDEHSHVAAIVEEGIGQGSGIGKSTALRSSIGGKVRDSKAVRQSSGGLPRSSLEVGGGSSQMPVATQSQEPSDLIAPPAYED